MIKNDTSSNTNGIVRISDDAIASIAAISAKKVNGVTGLNKGFFGRVAETLGIAKNESFQGVKVEIGDKEVWIEMILNVKFGCDISSVVAKVQENVKDNVENMTGLAVHEVNVNIREIEE